QPPPLVMSALDGVSDLIQGAELVVDPTQKAASALDAQQADLLDLVPEALKRVEQYANAVAAGQTPSRQDLYKVLHLAFDAAWATAPINALSVTGRVSVLSGINPATGPHALRPITFQLQTTPPFDPGRYAVQWTVGSASDVVVGGPRYTYVF